MALLSRLYCRDSRRWDCCQCWMGLLSMLDTLQRAEAIVRSGDAEPDELVRALSELGHFLDPEKTAPSPRSAQVFGRALDLMSDLKVEPDGPVLAEFLLSLAKYAYVAGQKGRGKPTDIVSTSSYKRVGTIPASEDLLEVDVSNGAVTHVGSQFGVGRVP